MMMHNEKDLRLAEPRDIKLPHGVSFEGSRTLKTGTEQDKDLGFFEYLQPLERCLNSLGEKRVRYRASQAYKFGPAYIPLYRVHAAIRWRTTSGSSQSKPYSKNMHLCIGVTS